MIKSFGLLTQKSKDQPKVYAFACRFVCFHTSGSMSREPSVQPSNKFVSYRRISARSYYLLNTARTVLIH